MAATSSSLPDRVVMGVPGLTLLRARDAAQLAALEARRLAPKLTIASASWFKPIYGVGWFGIAWHHPYVYFQEAGIKPFTMRSLAGKTIPMWVDDKDGSQAAKLPSKDRLRRTRTLPSGRKQVLIFRRAAPIGQRKNSWRNVNGRMERVSVPASYPGAAGRIAVNRSQGLIRQGDVNPGVGNPGQIAKGNVGVRWRHPGLQPGRFLAGGMKAAAVQMGLPVGAITYANRINSLTYRSYHPIVYQA